MTDRAAELEAAIASAPDDPEPYLVYADWLQAIDDPRGLLIVLQHHGQAERASALIEEHREHFLGPLAAFAASGAQGGAAGGAAGGAQAGSSRKLELAWHLGFIREARIGWGPGARGAARREAVNALEALLALPSSRFLRHLAIESAPVEGSASFGPFLEALAGAARPPPLRSLFVGQSGAPAAISAVAGVLGAYPELRHLTLRGSAISLGELRHAELRAFGIESPLLTPANLAELRAAAWPRLERLEISFHARARPVLIRARDLTPLLGGEGLRSLRHLGVRDCPFADEVVRALADSRLLPRLSSLDLSGGALSAAGVAAMARARLAFSHLAWLELDRNRLTRAATTLARGLAKHVHIGAQEPPVQPQPQPAAAPVAAAGDAGGGGAGAAGGGAGADGVVAGVIEVDDEGDADDEDGGDDDADDGE
ncbi:MAG TPA: TIGR02996 domain-containing protein [Kofleriaceae bacterium]|nr:TIGR02996 domain-containing protein [Kofleriaceae bacterium]